MTTHHHPDAGAPGERRYWLDDMRNVDKLVYTLYAICAGLLLIDVLVPKHGPFAIEHWFGFYGIYGFVACVGLVLAARALRVILMRPEDYYDR
jgi:hypothetical protein